MIYIRDLLNKIKWSKLEDSKNYKIGYEDKIKNEIVFIEFDKIKKIEKNFFVLEDKEIPLHRIKVVKKEDKIIWKR